MKYLPVFSRHRAMVPGCLAASMLAAIPSTAIAQEPGQPSPPVITYTPMKRAAPAAPPALPALPPAARPALPPPPSAAPVSFAISSGQLHLMAYFFSASTDEVMQRLWRDPGLAPLAVAASELAFEREHRGSSRRTAGIAVLLAGLSLATIIYVGSAFEGSTFLEEECDNSCQDARTYGPARAGAVGGVALVAGIGLIASGASLRRHRDPLEDRALRRFHQQDADRPPMPTHARAPSLAPPTRGFSVPLLSFRF